MFLLVFRGNKGLQSLQSIQSWDKRLIVLQLYGRWLYLGLDMKHGVIFDNQILS